MPRPNRARSIGIEDELVIKIGTLRRRRDWSYEELARRMDAQGCPMSASSLHRIEQGNPRRPVSVDELVAFSRVFETPVDVLIAPPDLDIGGKAGEVLSEADRAVNAVVDAVARAKSSLVEYELAKKQLGRVRSQLVAVQAQVERAAAGPWAEQMTGERHAPLLTLATRVRSTLANVDGALAAASEL
jgi:transcriptional regulator with XRE-family HTH domain